MKKTMMMVAALAACMATLADDAQARRLPAAAGMRMTDDCFQFSPFPNNPGAFNQCTTAKQISFPIVWDTTSAPGVNRTITFRGKRSANGLVQCQAFNYGTNGAIVAQSAVLSVTAVNSYQGINLTLNNVPAGSHGVVVCALGAGADGLLMGIDYSP